MMMTKYTTLDAYKTKFTQKSDIFNGNTPYPLLPRWGIARIIILLPRWGIARIIILLPRWGIARIITLLTRVGIARIITLLTRVGIARIITLLTRWGIARIIILLTRVGIARIITLLTRWGVVWITPLLPRGGRGCCLINILINIEIVNIIRRNFLLKYNTSAKFIMNNIDIQKYLHNIWFYDILYVLKEICDNKHSYLSEKNLKRCSYERA
jgi:hypothetical protein